MDRAVLRTDQGAIAELVALVRRRGGDDVQPGGVRWLPLADRVVLVVATYRRCNRALRQVAP